MQSIDRDTLRQWLDQRRDVTLVEAGKVDWKEAGLPVE